MRIIGGDNKGYRFSPPANIPARPTTDFAKEALFNILNNHFYFDEVTFLDLFGGTGNISYEMFSRGCRDITIVDLSPISIGFIRQITEKLELEADIIQDDVMRYLRNTWKTNDIIFAGPPYALETIDELPELVLNGDLLKDDGWFILETSPKHNYKDHKNLFKFKRYGQTHFWIFKHQPTNE